MNNVLDYLAIFTVAFVVIFSWIRYEKSTFKSFLYGIWIMLVYYLNIPLLTTLPAEAEVKWNIVKVLYKYHAEYGVVYTIVCSVFLAMVGIYVGTSSGIQGKQSARKVKKIFDDFCRDATQLKIIGRDLSFLAEDDYRTQKDVIYKLKDHAKLLCEWNNDEKMLDLYHSLYQNGIIVRAYCSRDGVANLKGQIKVDETSNTTGIFVTKDRCCNKINSFLAYISKHVKKFVPNRYPKSYSLDMFTMVELDSGFILNAVNEQFDKTFSNALHPYIRCIALDLGGVYFKGDIDSFYSFLAEKYNIHMKRSRKDRLNIDTDMMLGEIDICQFIKRSVKKEQKNIVENLSSDAWNAILNEWQITWKPSEKMKKLIEDLGKLGYIIVPFSNLDRINGDKYIRDHQLPACCHYHFFSYENKSVKPNPDAFDAFENFVTTRKIVSKPYQILLLDDEDENINMAEEKGWETIKFYNQNEETSVEQIIVELKKKSILPQNYDRSNEEIL